MKQALLTILFVSGFNVRAAVNDPLESYSSPHCDHVLRSPSELDQTLQDLELLVADLPTTETLSAVHVQHDMISSLVLKVVRLMNEGPMTFQIAVLQEKFRNHDVRPSIILGTSLSISRSDSFPYRVKYKDGLIYDRRAHKLDTQNAKYSTLDGRRLALYVMDKTGHIFVTPFHGDEFIQALLVQGHPAAGAGYMQIDHGKLKFINNSSVFYPPTLRLFLQTLAKLSRQGVELKGVKLQFVSQRGFSPIIKIED